MKNRPSKPAGVVALSLVVALGHQALAVGAQIAPAPGSDLAAQLAPIRAEIHRWITEEGTPSLAVALARDGEVVWEEGFGWADRERRIPATEHTIYSLASISKPITSTGLMLLVERGLVDLDRPVDDYLGRVRLNGRAFDASAATVRLVANHTAGLPLHYQFFYEDEPYHRPPMDETIRRYANLVTAPGERYQYSNLGYGILDYVISRVSGQTYPTFMRTEVFLPLGMTHTSVDLGPGLEAFAAQRYAPDGTPIPFYDFDHPGASAVFSSAHDLVRFGMFHLKNRLPGQKTILGDESLDEMQRPTAESGTTTSYGVGWSIRENEKGLRSFGHTGGMGGVSTTLVIVPGENTVFVALCNARSRAPHRVGELVLETLFPDQFEAPAQEESGGEGEEASEGPMGPTFQPMPEVAGTWSGAADTHLGEREVLLHVEESGAVYVRIQQQPWALVNDATYEDGFLRGYVMADIGTEDVNRTESGLRLEVKHRGDVLNGSLIGMTLPSNRVGNALTHWIELRRP